MGFKPYAVFSQGFADLLGVFFITPKTLYNPLKLPQHPTYRFHPKTL
jgi:hypothetical protein